MSTDPDQLPDESSHPDKAQLRRIGRTLRERLGANTAAYRIPADKAELWAIGDFLSAGECTQLMTMIDETARPSGAYDMPYESGYRTSYSGDVDTDAPFVKRIQRRIDDLLGLEPETGETVQGQRYQVGQQFQHHTDWFPSNTPYWEMERARGGQRAVTAMAFLNQVEGGGTTDFPRLDLSITPAPGALLVWNNAGVDGTPNPWTIHAGRPVTAGVKYIITRWYRVRRWL
ncbi:prolyl hydroxylase family protein [Croceibacterium ferulae]|uniref:prolyl hydroxylase family protein n=1 Tax=Croceibacterium ferulae TaxID=1854641 RepID=UPI000EAEABA2|nr:2OG-Fe(II) oxygenase [Croceibacterium ferulae]